MHPERCADKLAVNFHFNSERRRASRGASEEANAKAAVAPVREAAGMWKEKTNKQTASSLNLTAGRGWRDGMMVWM